MANLLDVVLMPLDLSRRRAFQLIFAAPAIVRAASLMPVKSWFEPIPRLQVRLPPGTYNFEIGEVYFDQLGKMAIEMIPLMYPNLRIFANVKASIHV